MALLQDYTILLIMP